MFSPRKFVEIKRRRNIFLPRFKGDTGASAFSRSTASKGHFVVYTTDGDRIVVPLMYLNSPVFKELLKISEEEFGLPKDGPITLPCDSAFLRYIISFLQGHTSTDMEKALIIFVASGCCSRSCLLHQDYTCQKLPIYSH